MTKEQAQAMSQYDSTNFPPQAEPEPRGLLSKLMHGNASLLKHTKPCEQRSSAMMLRIEPSKYHEYKNSVDVGRDFNDKAIAVRGFSVWMMLYVHICSFAKAGVIFVAPLAFVVLFFDFVFVGGEMWEYAEIATFYLKFILVFLILWIPLELHAKEKIKLPWLKEQKIFELSRETGMVTLYKSRERVRFSHPFIEFDCCLSSHPTPQGFLRRRLMLVHRYGGYKHGIPLTIFSHDHASQIEFLRVWATIQQYMDISQPLPDLLMLEPWRQRDATTREYDKAHNRPVDYWTSMSDEQFKKAVDKILAEQDKQLVTMKVLDIYNPR